MADDLAFLSIAELAGRYRSHDVTPTQATQAALDRIGRIDGKINSYITVTADLALSQAKAAEDQFARGIDRGPLQGIPIALKDLYATKGILTSAHSRVLIDNVPDEDSMATKLLADAGTVLLGKLAMHEFAFGTPTFDAPWPPARNPWNTDH